MNKPPEFWIALVAGIAFVLVNNTERSLFKRAAIAALSGGIGFALAPDVAAWTGRSETLAVMALTALGYAVLDVAAGLISDRNAQSLWRKWTGTKGGDE